MKHVPKKGRECTITEVEAIFGITEKTIKRWIEQGMPAQKTGSAWKINTAEMFAFVRAMDSGKKTAADDDYDTRIRAAKATIAETEAAEATGSVIEIEAVERAMAEVMSAARTRLVGVAPSVAGECAAAQTPAECREIIGRQVAIVCDDIADALQHVGRG